MKTELKPITYKPELQSSSAVVQKVAQDKNNRKEIPNQRVSCLNCPKAMWQESESSLQCYCRVTYMFTWTKNEMTNITACDGILIQ